MAAESLIGASVERVADGPILTGRATYIADLDLGGQLHARVVRSPVAHARVNAVLTEEARGLPGVVAVLTAADLPEVTIPIRLPFAETPDALKVLQPPLAGDVVRYVGEPVALVLAESAHLAEDAAELVELDLDELDCLTDVTAAIAEGTVRVHDALETNVVNAVRLVHGDVDDAFAAADIVVKRRLRMHRHSAIPLETRGLLAEPTGDGRLVLWGGAKVKHFTKTALSGMLGIAPDRITVAEVNVGGGFGVRGEPYPEDFLVAFAALRLGRPVKWIEDRAEHFVATNHGRDQVHELEVAASADGILLAFRDTGLCDQGAYVRSQGTLPSLLPALHLAGPYAWQAFEIETRGVLTNRTPVGTYRGPGMTEATYVRESMIDLVAARAGITPHEVRRRNLIPAASIPHVFELAPGSAPVPPLKYESGDFPAALDELIRRSDYDGLLERRDRARAAGQRAGVGLALYTEIGGIGPFEEASAVFDTDNRLSVGVGVGSLGQGVETVLAQIAAEYFGLSLDQVRIDHHDTDAVPVGFGAFASRGTLLSGNAIADAAMRFRQEAASHLGATVDGVELHGGVAWAGEDSLPLHKLGRMVGRFEKPLPSFSFGGAVSLVSVSEETGQVRVLEHAVMHDIGRAVNPALLAGQLVGAAAQGIAGALFEELAYDRNGQPLVTSFLDYRMPTAAEIPDIQPIIVEVPTPANPLGIKGGGESGMVATPAAVTNAVTDALRDTGVDVMQLPLTPSRVRAALSGAEGARSPGSAAQEAQE